MLPKITEYHQAISNPESFKTLYPDIKPLKDENGELIFASGNFAVVYKVLHKNQFYAVKCFLKEQEERIERLKAISNFINDNPSKYWVQMDVFEDELWVEVDGIGKDYTVVLMPWINAPTLGSIIRDCINSNALLIIGIINENLEIMFQWILEKGFAHGDLKHDNILINKITLQPILIDYDGMYIPKFEGKKAIEIGSPCFQHPNRSEHDFNDFLDDFSMFIILFSLSILVEAPHLWSLYNHDQNIVFDVSDFLKKKIKNFLFELEKLEFRTNKLYLTILRNQNWNVISPQFAVREEIIFNTNSKYYIAYEATEKGNAIRKEISTKIGIGKIINKSFDKDWSDYINGIREYTSIELLEKIRSFTGIQLNAGSNYTEKINLCDFKLITHFEKLVLNDIEDNQDISCFRFYSNLKHLEILNSVFLSNISVIKFFYRLEELKIYNCTSIIDLNHLKYLARLRTLALDSIIKIADFSSISKNENLEELYLYFLPEIIDISFLEKLPKIEKLLIGHCNKIPMEQYYIINESKNLKWLKLINMKKISNLDFLTNLNNLTFLHIIEIFPLENIQGISNLINLRSLEIAYVPLKIDLFPLSKLVNLNVLKLHGISINQNFDFLENLENLEILILDKKFSKKLIKIKDNCKILYEDSIMINAL